MELPDLFSLAGKVALITGTARGIGRSLAQGFLDAGATVLPVVRATPTDWIEPSGEQMERWLPLVCDLADRQQLETLPDRAWEAGRGRIDVLVNNAGVTFSQTEDPYDCTLHEATRAVLLDAPYFLCGRIAPRMAAQGGGSIINVTSINAEFGFPGNPAYVSSKGGLRMLTKAVARDFGAQNVRANNLCPGYIHTDMTAGSYSDPQRREELRNRTMLGRWGEPADLVGPCLFLASDAAAYVTGADLYVDGGWAAKGL
jgi:NAD(P)-dependent dehydrogenase (short-subunit alcohol dehydrogenase family)